MELQEQLLAIERRPWTNDAAFYEANLTEEALLVFAETGVIGRDVAVADIRTTLSLIGQLRSKAAID